MPISTKTFSQHVNIHVHMTQPPTLLLLHITGDIGSHNNEISDIERNIRSMQNDMTKLNTLITKESSLREALQQNTVLMENDFIQALRVRQLTHIKESCTFC